MLIHIHQQLTPTPPELGSNPLFHGNLSQIPRPVRAIATFLGCSPVGNWLSGQFLDVSLNRRDTTYRRSMFDLFANNIILFLSSYLVAVVSWILSSRLPRKRMRRAVRVSILYLVFPVFFLGHPFILFQFWMFVVAGIVLMEFKWIMTMLIIWTVLLMVSTHNVET